MCKKYVHAYNNKKWLELQDNFITYLLINLSFLMQGDYVADTSKHNGNMLLNGTPHSAPEYIPPPPPPPPLNEETLLLNDNYRQNEDNKFAGKPSVLSWKC